MNAPLGAIDAWAQPANGRARELLPEVVRELATGKIPWMEDPRKTGGKWKD